MSLSITSLRFTRRSRLSARKAVTSGFGGRPVRSMDAAEEVLIAAHAAGLDLHALPLLRDEFVDLVPGLRFLPREAGAVAHHGDGGGGIGAFKTSEHRCFTATQARHEAFCRLR